MTKDSFAYLLRKIAVDMKSLGQALDEDACPKIERALCALEHSFAELAEECKEHALDAKARSRARIIGYLQ